MTDEERKAKEKAAISTAVSHLVPIQKVAIEELTATQNDTYTAPSGKAYTPVTVNVSGGGGSSDFSTATVTLTNNLVGDAIQIYCATAIDYDDEHGSSTGFFAEPEESDTQTVILYKGMAFAYGDRHGGTVSVTGDIEKDGGDFVIAGNGTITIS